MNPIELDFKLPRGEENWKANGLYSDYIYLCHQNFKMVLPIDAIAQTVRLIIYNEQPTDNHIYYSGLLTCNLYEVWHITLFGTAHRLYQDFAMCTLCRRLTNNKDSCNVWFRVEII